MKFRVTRDKITIINKLDIPKFFEFITAIKTTAKGEIAVSLEQQGIEASASSLQPITVGVPTVHILQVWKT